MAITDTEAIERLITNLSQLQRVQCCYGPGGVGPDWHDRKGGLDLIAAGGASYDGTKATFDGTTGYFETSGTPAYFTGFAGDETDLDSYNGSGISLFMLLQVQPGDIASRVIVQNDNGGDYSGFTFRVNANGNLQIWTRSASQSGIYLTNPPSDRFVTVTSVDLRGKIDDGQPHLLVVSRGTTHPPEKYHIMLDGQVLADSGTGNGINLFSDPDGAFSLGKAAATTIIGDPAFSHFKGEVWVAALRNRWTTPEEGSAMWTALEGKRAKPRHVSTQRIQGRVR